jgi:hypothetical protein
MTPLARYTTGLLLGCLIVVLGCSRKRNRESLEAHAIAHVVKQMGIHEAMFPDIALTNPIQLYQRSTAGGYGYPYDIHRKFLALKEPIGFSNSIYEKYVFAVPPIRDERLNGDALVLVSADPFADKARRLRRMVVLRNGPNAGDYRMDEFEEERVQQLFRASGREIPRHSTTPPIKLPPIEPDDRPLGARIQSFFNRMAGNIGIGHSSGWVVMAALGITIVAVTSGVWLLFVLFRRRK